MSQYASESGGTLTITATDVTYDGPNGFTLPLPVDDVEFERGAWGEIGTLTLNGHSLSLRMDESGEVVAALRAPVDVPADDNGPVTDNAPAADTTPPTDANPV